TSQDTEIGKPAVAPQPVAGGEGKPVEPEGSPRPVSDGDTESNGIPVAPSSEAAALSKTEPASVPSEPDEPLTVGGDVKEPVEISRVPPVYPEAARKARLQGIVTVRGVITREGTVQSAQVLFGVAPLLDNAALRAFEQWKYQPATLNGKPVPVYVTATILFRLGATPAAEN
ncbi:MAG TPA: TonB family protein, partial [Thermoanaerobaculia bacterium]|nr:TonB family protein [Thermoanaerobaculia bacterium]